MRMFSSYPDHIKMEMPNLSPTMEKVSQLSIILNLYFIGKYWCMGCEDRRPSRPWRRPLRYRDR
jgi:hypothetical protein